MIILRCMFYYMFYYINVIMVSFNDVQFYKKKKKKKYNY